MQRPAPTLMERYALDTSFLLDLWKRDGAFAKDIFVGIWEAVQEGITSGEVIAPKTVRDELRDTTDRGLRAWVTDHASMFIPLDEAQLTQLTSIVRRFPGYANEPRNQSSRR